MCCETKEGMFLHTHTLTQRAYFLGSSADLSSTNNYLLPPKHAVAWLQSQPSP